MTRVTLDHAFSGAFDLTTGKTPNFKLAMYAAAMSSMQALAPNGRQTRILAPYVHKPLPSWDDTFEILRPAKGNLNGNHVSALFKIQELDNAGMLAPFHHLPTTYEEQLAWREALLKLITGYGMARKTISFAALIYSPLTCQLVPIDRHVMKRLGFPKDDSPKSKKGYLAVEDIVIQERKQAGYSHVPMGIWHWYKWEEWRVLTGDSKADEGVESHRDLSCCDY